VDWGKRRGGGGCGDWEGDVLVVHPVTGQDSGQEVKTRGPVECGVMYQLGRWSINIGFCINFLDTLLCCLDVELWPSVWALEKCCNCVESVTIT